MNDRMPELSPLERAAICARRVESLKAGCGAYPKRLRAIAIKGAEQALAWAERDLRATGGTA